MKKSHIKILGITLFIIALCCFVFIQTLEAKSIEKAEKTESNIQLYTLNCGSADIHDGVAFSDTYFYGHKPLHLVDPCFLIKHPKGWMLWDLGFGDVYVGHATGHTVRGTVMTINVPVSLISQLEQLGLTPEDIHYVSVSHTHFDHIGNANLFKKATWLIQEREYQSIQNTPIAHVMLNKTFLQGDSDVFGDGTVIILNTPGHTIGHQSLQIQLAKAGTIVLSGDVYHTKAARIHKLVPTFNYSRAETLASMLRLESIIQNTHGRLIIQHAPQDYAELPVFPQYLD